MECKENGLTRAVIQSTMASNFLAPVKTDQQIYENSMLEDDPNANSAVTHEEKIKPRWGPHHKGAQELANLYSRGKRTQERICVGICITLMMVNFYFIVIHFRMENLSTIVIAALCGIITADLSSGLVHWGADTWGSVELPIIGKIHKWSHTYFGLPAWVVFLQEYHVILPRRHHRIHHVAPHETYFCITTGWLNWPLEKICFWQMLEWVIERVTGCRPRADDMKWAQKRA